MPQLQKVYLNSLFIILVPILAYLSGYNILFETTDSVVYREFYENLDVNNPLDSVQFEYGFVILAFIGKAIFKLGYFSWVSIINLISLSIKFWLFSKQRNSILIILIYVFLLFPFYECLVVRASIAHAVVLFALNYYSSKKIKYLFAILVASSLHISVLLFLVPIVFPNFWHKSISPSKVLVVFLSLILIKQSLILLLEFYPRVAPYYYDNPKYFNSWGIPRIVIILLAWFYYFRKLKSNFGILCSNLVILFTVFAISTFEFSLFSIRVLDLILPLYFILLIVHLKHFKLGGYYLLLALIFELFFVRSIDGAVHTVNFIKWLG